MPSTKLSGVSLVTLLVCGQGWLPQILAFGLGDRRFKYEGLLDTGSGGLGSENGPIVALGDSNGDQFQDVFVLGPDQRSVRLYLWDNEAYTFVGVPHNPVVARPNQGFVITNVVAADVNHDGRLDLLLMGATDPDSRWTDTLQMEVWYGVDGTHFANGVEVPASALSQPIVFDAQGDMKVDLLGLSTSSTSLQIWQNGAVLNQTTPFTVSGIPFGPGPPCTPPNPHSNAFIDLNGDCLADIFLTCQEPDGGMSYQIWQNAKDKGFLFSRNGTLPPGTKQISFADMDRDGTIDMVFPACQTDDTCRVHIAFNLQMQLCSEDSVKTGERCREPHSLCSPDDAFRFSFDSDAGDLMTIPVDSLFGGQNLVTTHSTSHFSGQAPLALQIGDYNLDGYPDLLLLTSPRGFFPTSRSTPRLLESRPCDLASCTAGEVSAKRRAFRPVQSGATALDAITDARSAFFMDVADDGTLDIVVQRDGKRGGLSRSFSFIKNNFFNDAFFLKAMMLNGACQGWCVDAVEGSQYRPYGVNYPGASYKFIIQDTSGRRSATAVGQLPYSSYASVSTPYSYFGLGRTNNYVENLFVGSTRHQAQHFVNIEGLIPNSQVVISPYQPPGQSTPATWTRELYLHPGDWIPFVIATLGVATLILGLVVIVLHVNEKREDELERRRKAHTINFDAL